MKKIVLMMAAVSIFAACLPAAAQSDEKFPCYADVTGYAERDVTPDTFYLTIVIAEKDSKGRISVENQQRDMLKSLRSLGVDTDRQLTMADMSGEYFKKKNTLLTVQYRLKLTSSADVQRVYSALGELGISSVTIRSVSCSKMNEVRNEVRIEAMKNAREKATMLAEAVGQGIGACIRINDYSRDVAEEAVMTYNLRVVKTANADADFMLEDEDVPEFKPIKVTGNVNARFVLLGPEGETIR